jgi:cyclic pyranopterin phosphate synthase
MIDFISSLTSRAGIEDISLTTNGVLLGEMIDALVSSGRPRLNVSLDSLNARRFEKITGCDVWEKVWRGIERAEELGFAPLKINMVPVKGVNDDEVVDFCRLTLKRHLHVRFIEFMPIGSRDRWNTDVCVTAEELRADIERELGPLVPFSSGIGGGPSENFQIPGARGVIGFISPISKHFCARCRRLRLTADGKIRPCLLSDTEIDLKSPMRSGCDDAEIERLLRLSLSVKPERHYLNTAPVGTYRRTMSKIGG